jgi:hypothetical protein
MENFQKKYQLWLQDQATDAFVPTEYDSLNECVQANKPGRWYITKRVVMNVSDADEMLQPIVNTPMYDKEPLPPEVRADSEENSDITDAYLRGGIGKLEVSGLP